MEDNKNNISEKNINTDKYEKTQNNTNQDSQTKENNILNSQQQDNNIQDKTHKRRVRYKGTHPRTFAEKYKEHNPEKYKDTIEKVISKGSTPAGMHISIMVQEILDFLEIKPGQKGLDATLGYGGHTSKMLEKLEGKGHVYGLDIDPIEIEKTKKRLKDKGFGEDIFTGVNINFKDIDKVAEKYGKFDFVLADLGVSSMQIDNPERGFTYKYEGPLDLRLNPNQGISAAERINTISMDELEGMLIENSDEPYAYEIAKTVVEERRKKKIETTTQLKDIIEKALIYLPKKEREEAVKKSCARTFQALRIALNDELARLEGVIPKMIDLLNDKGRLSIITFHSLEDRIVKNAFRTAQDPCTCPSNFPVCVCGKKSKGKVITKKAILPSEEELEYNSRAKSAKLRVFERVIDN